MVPVASSAMRANDDAQRKKDLASRRRDLDNRRVWLERDSVGNDYYRNLVLERTTSAHSCPPDGAIVSSVYVHLCVIISVVRPKQIKRSLRENQGVLGSLHSAFSRTLSNLRIC